MGTPRGSNHALQGSPGGWELPGEVITLFRALQPTALSVGVLPGVDLGVSLELLVRSEQPLVPRAKPAHSVIFLRLVTAVAPVVIVVRRKRCCRSIAHVGSRLLRLVCVAP